MFSLSADENIVAAAGKHNCGGMVNIFRFESSVEDWVSMGQIVNNYTDRNFWDYYFGYSISLSTDEQVVAVGHPSKNW